MSFDEIRQSPEIVQVLKKFAQNPRGAILLSGTNGSGKTFASMKVYEAFARYKLPQYDHDNAWIIKQVDLNTRFTKACKEWGDASDLLQTLGKTRLLILDDIGTRTPSEPFMDFLYAIVDQRFDNRYHVGTIITTNLKMNAMREKFSDAFVSRVAYNHCFRIDEPDRRSI